MRPFQVCDELHQLANLSERQTYIKVMQVHSDAVHQGKYEQITSEPDQPL